MKAEKQRLRTQLEKGPMPSHLIAVNGEVGQRVKVENIKAPTPQVG